jgi:tetratricopeptide (TPR) repeat protein/CHAT domain-containing protein
MFQRLVQWLNSFLKCAFGGKQAPYPRTRGEVKVLPPPPELTNADLEFLFTELLEGVYQARGQQWAVKFLQRMEHRITHERWIQWLLSFGERLLSSPAPNNNLAERMVQLGELNIGQIGELAYDIGVSLLTRNLGEGYWQKYENDTVFTVPEEEQAVDDFPLVWEYQGESTPVIQNQEGEIRYWDAPQVSVPDTSVTLDELLIRLDESADFVRLPYVTEGIDQEVIDSLAKATTPEEQAEVWFYQGLKQAKADDLSAAIASYDKAIQLNQNLHEYWFNRGLTLFHLERYFEALASYDRALELKSDFYQGWYNRGGLLGELGLYEDAVTSFDNAIEIKPDYHEALSSRGLALRRLGRLLQAISNYDKALLLQPEDQENWYYRGLALAEGGRFDDAIQSYDKALEILPDYYEAWSSKGTALYNLGRFEEAIICYEKAIEIKPDYQEAWSGRSDTLYNLEQIEEWNLADDLGVELAPENQEALFEQSNNMYNSEQLSQIVPQDTTPEVMDVDDSWQQWEDFLDNLEPEDPVTAEQIAEEDDDYDPGWYDRGVDMYNLGRYVEALTCYDHAIESHPDNDLAWYNRGIVLGQLGRIEEAIASYYQACAIRPDFHEAWIDKGVAQMQLGRAEDAIQSWDKALEIQPEFYLTWYNRGVALDSLKRRSQAVTSYDEALQIEPNFHLAWYNRGVALFYLGQYEEAIASYDHALDIQQDYWEAWIGRGTAAGNIPEGQTPSYVSSISLTNPALELRGLEGKLASYEEGLKYISETQKEGWGRLHLAIANTYYEQGRKHPTQIDYWFYAAAEYNQALQTLTVEEFPQLHLEIVQHQIKTLLHIQETEQAQQWLQYGSQLLQNFLSEAERSNESKLQLALKNVGLGQLSVDIAVQSGDLIAALEIAEHSKNTCFNWLTFGWTDTITSPNYAQIQQLLNPTTAIIYWHISPYALQTFIIKHNTEPLLLTANSEAVQALIESENWLKDWNEQYQDYHNQPIDRQIRNNHSWQLDMDVRLLQLQNILNISTIVPEISDVTHLIFIPHRDLHRFPLHAFPLFSNRWEISYLPSAQLGLSIPSQSSLIDTQSLLIVEQPKSTDYPTLKYAKLESEAITQMFDNHLHIQGVQATKIQVENALLGDYNILHFIGYCNQSEMILADEKITLAEISQKSLGHYNLVTLSACETNVNTHTTEYVNLVSAFLNQRVASVVSTLWSVESAASALVMIEFYQQLQQHKSPATALTEATKWLKELTAEQLRTWYENLLGQLSTDGFRIGPHLATELYRASKMDPEDKLYDQPYYWAGYTITGR